jgi:hypothetical protein
VPVGLGKMLQLSAIHRSKDILEVVGHENPGPVERSETTND